VTRTRLAILLFALSCAATGGALPAPAASAEARQAEVTRITMGTGAQYPRLVTLNGDPVLISVDVETTERTTVTASAAGSGLSVANPTQSHQTFENPKSVIIATSFTFQVTATTPGMHAFTVTVTPDGGASQSATMPYVISRGSTPITATASLAGRTYGYESVEGSAAASSRYVKMMTFVDDRYAFMGLPPAGRPTCTPLRADCLPYAYDESTGLLQVGGDIVGRVDGQELYTDGWVRQSSSITTGTYIAKNPLTYAPRDTRLAGTWRYRNTHYHQGMWSERLVLRKDGTYKLAYTTTGSHTSTTRSKGTYRITGPGRIVFREHGRVFSIGTLALLGNKVDKPRANKLGLWLLLSGRHGRATDGNLLYPAGK